jgi:hypothetical protein
VFSDDKGIVMPKNKTPTRLIAGQRQGVAINSANLSSRLRAREPIGRSFGLVRGKFPSRKVGRMIHWESQLERDAVYLFEFSSGVTSYREQPLTTYYTLDGKTRRYTPDFELTLYTGEVILIEVKPSEKLSDPDERHRFERIGEHFSSMGNSFRILTELEIRQKELLENLRMVARYRGACLLPTERLAFRKLLAGQKIFGFQDAIALFTDVTIVWRMIGESLLSCDLTKLVTEQTTLYVTTARVENEKLFF